MVFEGRTVRVRDLKGMRYLARLLADPGREFHVLDLVAAESRPAAAAESGRAAGLSRTALGDAGEMLDARAKDAYRRRLAEIEDDIEQARALGDTEREAQADAERDFLVRELSRAVGLGGRDRRAASASERARVSVTRAVRQAIARIGEHHPAARRAPRPHHPHRHLLRLPSRPSRPRRLGSLIDGVRSAPLARSDATIAGGARPVRIGSVGADDTAMCGGCGATGSLAPTSTGTPPLSRCPQARRPAPSVAHREGGTDPAAATLVLLADWRDHRQDEATRMCGRTN